VSSVKYKILKNSDLFLEVSTLLIALQGVGISSELILTCTINHNQGGWLTIEAKHLDLRIRLPPVGPIKASLPNSSPEFMEIEVIQARDKDVEFLHTTSGFQNFVNSIFLPFLVSYFEKIKFIFPLNFQPAVILGQIPGKWDGQLGMHQVTTELSLLKLLLNQSIGMISRFRQMMSLIKIYST
jgi:hypothetical protein